MQIGKIHARLAAIHALLISHRPNVSVKPTPTSFTCGFPARFALRCGLPVALATMSKLSRFVSIASLCLLLVGCYETYPPIKSASITHWQGGKPQGAALQLTPENIAKLSAWLQNHRWGWHPVIATYAPATLLTLTHSDGTISSANLMQKTLIVGQNQRKLSASESQELHSIIGAQNGG